MVCHSLSILPTIFLSGSNKASTGIEKKWANGDNFHFRVNEPFNIRMIAVIVPLQASQKQYFQDESVSGTQFLFSLCVMLVHLQWESGNNKRMLSVVTCLSGGSRQLQAESLWAIYLWMQEDNWRMLRDYETLTSPKISSVRSHSIHAWTQMVCLK